MNHIKNKRIQKIIVFDLDQTLFNHNHGETSALKFIYNTFFKPYEQNYRLFESNFHYLNKQSWELFEKGELTIAETVRHRFIELSKLYNLEHISNEIFKVYTENYILNCIPFKNVDILLSKLINYGYCLAVCSNGMQYIQDSKLRHHDLSGSFSYYHYGTIVPLCKPHNQFFEGLLKSIQKKAQDVIFIGDSIYHDILPAKKLGMRYLHFNDTYLDKGILNWQLLITHIKQIY